MTVSSSVNRELTVGEIWRRAYQLAGLYEVTQSLRDADKGLAKDMSEAIVDQLPLYGVSARQRTFEEVTLVSGTYKYNLPATVLDVVGDGQYIAASTTDLSKAPSESAVVQRDMETWHRMSAKNASGRPNIFFANRVGSTVAAWYWPIPDEAGTIRHVVQRHLADMNDESSTMDLETYWVEYVIWELAHHVAEAMSVPGSKIDRLGKGAASRLARARAFANQHTDNYFLYDHRVG